MPLLTLNGSPSARLALLPEQSAERETGAKRGALPAGALADRAPIRHAALPIELLAKRFKNELSMAIIFV
jgi:hypothetical protein